MNMVGTPCSAVQRSLATRLKHRQRLEALARQHARRAMRHGRQHAEHHAEAVIQRHRECTPGPRP